MSSRNEPPARIAPRRWTLRTTLLLSHAGLVLASFLGFGGLLYATSVFAIYRQAEADQLAVAQELLKALQEEPDPARLTISDLYRHRFGMAPRDHAYIVIWDRRGRLLYASEPLPPHVRPGDSAPPASGPHPFHTRAAGPYFDVIVATPGGGQLLVGRPLMKEWDALERLVLRMLGLGGLCLAGGAAVAAWLSRRFSDPLSRLATAAEHISSHRLHERIPPMSGSTEIARLGEVYNRMLARLQDAFEKQSRFIADASHELRTPVSVLLSQTEHSLNRQRSPDEYRRALELCRETSRRMRSLIDGLLLLARADAGKPIRRREPVDLAEVVASCVEQLGPMAAQARVGIVTDLRASPVHGDPERLAQVVTNLVTNAIRYNNPNGQVRVESRPDAEEVALIVRDDGIGISLEHQPLLFDRFYRVDDARTQHDETGAGLGLSLVQEIVLAHGGRIQVRSAPGSGSEFSVHLPAAHEPGEPRPI